MTSQRIRQAGILSSALVLCALSAAGPSRVITVLHAIIPAGYEVLTIKPGDATLTFLGLIECPALEGAQQVAQGANARIVNADGKPLEYFPGNFSFRITASLRKTLLIDPSFALHISETPQDLLLHLKFRLRIYHGLEVREIEPDSVEMIGVPAEIPYDERVYRVSFAVVDLPVTDRCVLLVLSSDGERITRFHFDLL